MNILYMANTYGTITQGSVAGKMIMNSDFFHTFQACSDVHIVRLRNRKRVACVYGVIMHAGNVRRIREKRVKYEE